MRYLVGVGWHVLGAGEGAWWLQAGMHGWYMMVQVMCEVRCMVYRCRCRMCSCHGDYVHTKERVEVHLQYT